MLNISILYQEETEEGDHNAMKRKEGKEEEEVEEKGIGRAAVFYRDRKRRMRIRGKRRKLCNE